MENREWFGLEPQPLPRSQVLLESSSRAFRAADPATDSGVSAESAPDLNPGFSGLEGFNLGDWQRRPSPSLMSKRVSAVVVLVTVPTQVIARRVAKRVLEDRVAACVQILPAIESHYRWKGEVKASREFLLVFKTLRRSVSALRRTVLELHPYEVPQFLVLPVESGTSPYLQWIATSLRPAAGGVDPATS